MNESAATSAARPRLIVFGDDWGRHSSSAQHLARELSAEFRIDWVHTIGTRRPRLQLRDLRRGLGKLRDWTLGATAGGVPEGLRLHAPVMWPGFRTRAACAANNRLLARFLRRLLARGPAPAAVITTVPLVADLARRHRQLRWIYYCVDALDQWPGLDGAVLARMEQELLPHMSAVVATSPLLVERLRRAGAEPHLITHGVTLASWQAANGARSERQPRLRPQALFWGSLDERLDVPTCLRLAAHADLHLLGRLEGVPRPLRDDPRIVFEPAMPVDRLPARAAQADVLVMPFRDTPATRAMQPLKLKEYLATGLPTVVTALPAIEPWRDALDVATDPEQFVASVMARAGAPLPAGQRSARDRLVGESWAAKASAFAAVLRTERPCATVLDVRCVSGPGTGPDKTILLGARHLQALGRRSLVALLHDPADPGFQGQLAAAASAGCTVIPVPDRGPFDRSVVDQLLAICRREQVRIWHGHDHKSDLLGLLVRRRHGMHLVTTAHGRGHDTWKTPLYQAIDRWCMRRYDRVLAVSQAMAAACRRAGVAPARLRLLPNAIEAEAVQPAPRVPRTPLRLGAVGRLAPEKGLLDVFEAVARLQHEGHAVELVVFGEGPQRAALERWIAARAPARGIRLAGFEPDRNRIYDQLDVFVLGSHREGMPNVLLEAMAKGLPVVATAVGGNLELVEHGRTGLLCAARQPAALAAALRTLCSDAPLRARLGDAARARVVREHSFAERMVRLAGIYDELDSVR